MKLFFETSGQAQAFLAAVPLGMILAAALDISRYAGRLKPLADVMTLLLCGLSLIILTLALRDAALRLYHVLAVAIGALLYTGGIGRLIKAARKRLGKKVKDFKDKAAGDLH
ncbi:MAG: spore cortex biosynthesis protein YabQ [Clostridiales bacterium]|nr:spore cortex biosynthesis protein YabQ [Clostridiales bacterium]MDY4009687.1 spore cortex biosynthesis protein YabQ [Candidatus Limiplasma sp.]